MRFFGNFLKSCAVSVFIAALLICASPSIAEPSPQKVPLKPDKNREFKLVENGEINVCILIPQKYTKDELEAARMLAKYLAKIANKGNVHIAFTGREPEGVKIISLSKDKYARDLSALSDDFSNIVKNTLRIKAKEIEILYSLSPQNAVGDFLNTVGLRFFAPSEIGSVIPKYNNFNLRAGEKEFNSNFLYVNIYGHSAGNDWFLLNGGRFALNGGFSHNLLKIFNADAFKENPEFSPILLPFRNPLKAQPNFSSLYAPQFAATQAAKFFKEHPDKNMFSIGINDSLYFDVRTPQNPPPKDFFRGYPSYSDAYFSFAAETAKLVGQSNPGKFLGCLAYLSTEAAPNFKLPSNLTPFLTTDRANYFNANFRKEDFNLLKAWTASGVKIAGVYDYLYGNPFLIPRSIDEYVWQGIEYAKEAGIRAYFAEAAANWAYDGAKLWVAMRLLNGSNSAPATIEREFYRSYYPQSHVAVFEFFEISKSAWAQRTDIPSWLAFYQRDAGAELFPEPKIQKMEAALKAAESLALSRVEKQRVFEIRLSFEVTKAFCKNYFAKKNLFNVQETENISEIIDAIEKTFETEKSLFAAIKIKSLLSKYPNPFLKYKNDFAGPMDSLYLKILSKSDERQKKRVRQMLSPDKLKTLESAMGHRRMLTHTDFNSGEYILDAEGIGRFPPAFRTILIPNRNADFRIAKGPDGNFVSVKNCNYAEIAKFLNVDAQAVYSFKFEAAYLVSISTTAYATLVFLDENSNIIERKSVSIPSFDSPQNRTFEIVSKAPKNAKYAVFAIIGMEIKEGDFLKIKNISFEEAN